MTKAIVCIGDHCTGILVHVCMSGSSDVLVNGRSACRKGDILTLGETITQGSSSVFVNGYSVAKAGDVASCGFQMISSKSNVFAG
jgi:uncharacterized Zn-binding protein involved in type VI secretion